MDEVQDDVDMLEKEGEIVTSHSETGKTKEEIRSLVHEQFIRVDNNFLNYLKEEKGIVFGSLTWNKVSDRRILVMIHFLITKFLKMLSTKKEQNNHFMIRGLFYESIKHAPKLLYEPDEIVDAANIICNKYDWSRRYLPMDTVRNGLLFLSKGTFLKGETETKDKVHYVYSKEPYTVPGTQTTMEWVELDTNADFVLILESQSQFNDLINTEFYKETTNSITFISQGMPSLALRFLINKMYCLGVTRDKIKVYCFLDSDGWGFSLGTLMRFGAYSQNVVRNNHEFIIPKLIPVFVVDDGEKAEYDRKEKTPDDETGLKIAEVRLTLEHIKDEEIKKMAQSEVGEWMNILQRMANSDYVVPHKHMGNLTDFLKLHPKFQEGNYFKDTEDETQMIVGSQSSQMSNSMES